MVSSFICGSSNFIKEEDDNERHTRSADSSPRKSKSSKNSSNKNPYSSRGLEKFSALLAEIEEKRQQVYSRVDPDEISLVRFAYAGDRDFKPIVVKIKPKISVDHDEKQTKSDVVKPLKIRRLQSSSLKKEIKMDFCKNLRVWEWKESQIYLVMIVILVLIFLVLFGRSFAIMCTSIGWYVIPTITKNSNSSSNMRVSSKNKDYAVRKLNEKKFITSEGTKSFKTSDER